MDLTIEKDVLSDKLATASRFTSNKISSGSSLQGILLKAKNDRLQLFATNLNTFFSTSIELPKPVEKIQVIFEPKKILEFMSFLPAGPVTVSLKDAQITIKSGKTKGNFPLMKGDDFPFPPEMKDKPTVIDMKLLRAELPLVLFSASTDDTRPVLTGVNFLHSENELLMAATDGFRLSVLKEKKLGDFPSMIIPADFLQEVLRYMKDSKELEFWYSPDEKMVRFSGGGNNFYSRLIEGDYPPFERVIPSETVTKITLDKGDFQRNIKLISVFARDFSNVVVCEFTSEGVKIRPKKEGNEENSAFQEIQFEGEPQTVAFNFRFLLDMLNNFPGNEVVIEILRPDAPSVFRTPEHSSFMHVIMPVRIQE